MAHLIHKLLVQELSYRSIMKDVIFDVVLANKTMQ